MTSFNLLEKEKREVGTFYFKDEETDSYIESFTQPHTGLGSN